MYEKKRKERKNNPFKMLISGGFGGMCNIATGYPLDTIKVRLQTMPLPAAGENPIYTGTFDCAKKIISQEGFHGLYKGMVVPLMGVVPIQATCFFGYALGKWFQQNENHSLTYPQIFIAGSFAGVLSALFTAPGERIKCLLQVQQESREKNKYNGMLDTAVKLYKEGGVRSLFKGTCATLLRDVPGNGLYFIVYEYLQNILKKRNERDEITLSATLLAGGMSGIAYWLLIMPCDVLKSRLQTAPEGTYSHGIRSVFKELIAKEGVLALYRGMLPVLLRAFPANAITFFGIELANKFFDQFLPNF